ncbi:MAG TPA: hypothetical protein V6C86_21180 [Oculatellaceae cyanobacterium]
MKFGVRETPQYPFNSYENVSSCILATIVLITGCSSIPSSHAVQGGPWTRQYFDLPRTTGNAYLDVRPAHDYLAKYEYRLDVKYGEHEFHVAPFMQASGAPNLKLDFIEPEEKTGPFIRIIHDAQAFAGPKIELLDLKEGKIFDPGNQNDSKKSINKSINVANAKFSPLGYLDANCNFALPDGSLARQDSIEAGAP